MKVARETITLSTEERTEFLDVTKQIRDAVQKHPISDGIVLVNSLHTTVALFVNEYQGALIEDLKVMVSDLIKFAYDSGYELTFGEAWRSDFTAAKMAAEGKGIANSLH